MDYVVLRSFDNYVLANIQLSMLRSEGINCHLKDEINVTLAPFLSPALGGMKLMVSAAEAEKALELLSEADAGK